LLLLSQQIILQLFNLFTSAAQLAIVRHLFNQLRVPALQR
jgi:hypothetical protein